MVLIRVCQNASNRTTLVTSTFDHWNVCVPYRHCQYHCAGHYTVPCALVHLETVPATFPCASPRATARTMDCRYVNSILRREAQTDTCLGQATMQRCIVVRTQERQTTNGSRSTDLHSGRKLRLTYVFCDGTPYSGDIFLQEDILYLADPKVPLNPL